MPKSGGDGLWPGSVGNQCLALEFVLEWDPVLPWGLQEGMGTNRETSNSCPPIPANFSSVAVLLGLQLFTFQILLNMSKGMRRQRRTMLGMVSVLGCSRKGGILNSYDPFSLLVLDLTGVSRLNQI